MDTVTDLAKRKYHMLNSFFNRSEYVLIIGTMLAFYNVIVKSITAVQLLDSLRSLVTAVAESHCI
jgi:hypothetical protein